MITTAPPAAQASVSGPSPVAGSRPLPLLFPFPVDGSGDGDGGTTTAASEVLPLDGLADCGDHDGAGRRADHTAAGRRAHDQLIGSGSEAAETVGAVGVGGELLWTTGSVHVDHHTPIGVPSSDRTVPSMAPSRARSKSTPVTSVPATGSVRLTGDVATYPSGVVIVTV